MSFTLRLDNIQTCLLLKLREIACAFREKEIKKKEEDIEKGKQPSMCAGWILMRPEALNNESLSCYNPHSGAWAWHDHCTWGSNELVS